MTDPVKAFVDALLAIDRLALEKMVSGADPANSLAPIDELVVPALESIGEQWERGDVSLSQVYMSGRLCEELITGLPQFKSVEAGEVSEWGADGGSEKPPLRIGISTLDDYHLLGKRMVCAVLRASGYRVRDYGTADAATLAEHVVRDDVQVLLLSVLMLPSALRVKNLRAALDAAGQRTRILVGGAPFRFDPNLYHEVGADAFGATAADALALVRAAEEASR
ncbi:MULTISPECIES: cobalamin B12-binding domain-containing protein [Thiorhodovibrio]|uniref:cobalamin B12-binding domain-containing protein n=1 Tax=Thiorhodovibrio TaxID=61593 RepID=UPI001913C437|nr:MULTISPECIES: cobalamin-dependent protein [Thiorhodovibrio]MBK5970689.1 cobalamin-binding protein [Thiorhodovibrio winogradskyi]WPL14233.1 B12-dependent methionine synthase [Thiorhodovibrio litoralis]